MSLRDWLFGGDDEGGEETTPTPPLYEHGLAPNEASIHVTDGMLRAGASAGGWFGDDQTAVVVDSHLGDEVKINIRAWMDDGATGSAFAYLDAETARELAADLEHAADEVDDAADGGDEA